MKTKEKVPVLNIFVDLYYNPKMLTIYVMFNRRYTH